MKINFADIPGDSFMTHQHEFAGEMVTLVQPIHIGAKYDLSTLKFRSSVWSATGHLISASFPKFFNWDEQPAIHPIPSSLTGADLMEKVDGSTLIVSRYKGQTMIRTRGTIDARKLDNGFEIDGLIEKYSSFFKWIEEKETTLYSYVFEWVSPVNKIVIGYDESDMYLTAAIDQADYSLASQSTLDVFAKEYGLKRPRRFSYDSIDEMKASVEALKGMEGLCVYYNDGQSIRKVKSAEYLAKHRMKSELSSMEKVLDLWLIAGRLSYSDFFAYCEKAFDYEVASDAQGFISRIADAYKEVQKIVDSMKVFVGKLNGMSRKDAALKILQAYGDTNRASFAFQLLDGKELDDDKIKRLMYQVMKD